MGWAGGVAGGAARVDAWRCTATAATCCFLPSRSGLDVNRSFEVGTWDAREWLATLVGCERSELAVRSIDRYGPTETQVRYERGDEAVARLVVAGPIVPMGTQLGQGHWLVSVRI